MPQEKLDFDAFLQKLRDSARNTTHKGKEFEKAMAALLPQLPDREFAEAWLWADWPKRQEITGLDAKDIGIDIVARIRDSDEYWAVQCKFYDPETTISHGGDLGTFFTASGRAGFSGRLIITTTDRWTSTAEKMLGNQQIDTHRLRLQDLRDLNIGWNWVRPDKTALLAPEKKSPFPRQQEAIEAAQSHFAENERGQLIMACGTGKTFTSLKIAESLVPEKGSVLFIVPSLSLMKQTITEWARERDRDHRYMGICSDATVGHQDEDGAHVADISVPVSTNKSRITTILKKPIKDNRISVVFCTYQSLDRLSEAQKMGAPEFDLVICDEAHRTTGVDQESRAGSNVKNSNFVRIHDQDFIKGKKRLYMTATPRIYAEPAKQKAEISKIGIFSMDDENQYGKEFYRLGFAKAVEEGLLSDYRVIVLTVAQDHIVETLSTLDKKILEGLDLSTDDAAKIVGCYKALRDQGKGDKGVKLKRAVSFSNTIKNSEMVCAKFEKIVKALDAVENDGFTCDLDHVDGKQSALERSRKLDWLRAEAPDTPDGKVCRILSNARCLTEGVDVPSLDAALFMNPRKSQVDVVQAVGRVMRKAKGKDYGYVILPVVIPMGEEVEDHLDKNETFGVVWEVLRALRAHDDRLTNYMSKLELNRKKPDNISVIGIGLGGDEADAKIKAEGEMQLRLEFSEEIAGLIYAKIVDKVGDRRYLEQWAQDTANLHDLLVKRIDELRANHPELKDAYGSFLESLKASINDGLTADDASSMLAQQLITKPIFDALFNDYHFSKTNVVSSSLDEMLDELAKYGLQEELKPLDSFYDSVTNRVRGLDNDEARQKVITELYEKFFTTAFPKISANLGIAYTPIPIVDFILKSADEVMRAEFGRGLSDEGVHIIDPFTGTGSFIVRLLNNPELIKDSDLQRKFNSELWANEILLLAYYIASVNIEMAHHQRGEQQYQSFPGISLTDTFELFERDMPDLPEMLADNSERITKQRKAPIRVVVGNPPWSAGQRSTNDNNANRVYPALRESISQSYGARSSATLLNKLHDSYIRAVRWASDRIGEEGLVAFVMPYAWLDRSFADGMRLCLEEEFDAIWVFDLRGDIRKDMLSKGTAGEGENVFAQATQNGVCISLFVKNPSNKRAKAEIKYHDIGDGLSHKEKIKIITSAATVSGLEWRDIKPNEAGDWLNQRDPLFQDFIELGNDAVKRGKVARPETIFRSYSLGVSTNRYYWVYNFGKANVENNAGSMISYYNTQMENFQDARKLDVLADIENTIDRDPAKIKWSSSLLGHAQKGNVADFDRNKIRKSMYGSFNSQYLYFDKFLNDRQGRIPSYFPNSCAENKLICVTGAGARGEFSCLITDQIPSLGVVEVNQTFPRWVYREDEEGKLVRDDNITDHCLHLFQSHYSKGKEIRKDDIFHYCYGVLHAPDYRERFATDLRLSLPRIPMVEDFWAFANAGAELVKLHLGWQLDGDPKATTELALLYDGKPAFAETVPEEAYKVKKMRWEERPEGKFVKYSQHLSIGPIPEDALHYTIGNNSPVKWIIDSYQVKTDTASGITNDPNDWIAEQRTPDGKPMPDALVQLIKRVTYLSIETDRIVKSLPKAVPDVSTVKIESNGSNFPVRSAGVSGELRPIRIFPLPGKETRRSRLLTRFSNPNDRTPNKDSFFVKVEFALPKLEADHISASDFSSQLIEAFAKNCENLIFSSKDGEYQFAISDFGLFCEDGSKKGKLKVILSVVTVAGGFVFSSGTGIGKALSGYADLINAQNQSHNQCVEQVFKESLEEIEPEAVEPPDDAGGYEVPEVNESDIMPHQDAEERITHYEDELPTIKGTDTSNRGKEFNLMQRESANEPFKKTFTTEK